MSRYTRERSYDPTSGVGVGIEAHRVNRAHYRTDHQGYEAWTSVSDGEQERVAVHRLLAVAEYGFDAVCDKLVHHGPEAEIPWANWPGNIQLMSRGEHMMHHHHPDAPTKRERAKIYEAYINSDHTQKEVAEEFGVSKWVVVYSVRRLASEHDEQPNAHLRKKQLSWDDRVAMYEEYQNGDVTQAELAERYNIDESNVSRSIQRVREERQ